MKKIFFLALSSLFVTVPHALAAGSGFVPLAPIPGLTDFSPTAVVNSETLAAFLNNLYMYLIGLAAILAVIEIIWGGLEISTKDSVSAQMDGKERIRGAILGLVLVLSPALVFTIINPNILNLSLNLPELKTASGPTPGGGGPGPGGGGPSPVANCTNTSGTSNVLQIATCTTQDATQKWREQFCANGGRFASITKTNPANGIPGYVVTCEDPRDYVFVFRESFSGFPINAYQPVGISASSPRPTNGDDAINFASTCSSANLGLATCIIRRVPGSDIPCQISGPNAATTWKCYARRLSCVDSTIMNTIDGNCSGSPSWSKF